MHRFIQCLDPDLRHGVAQRLGDQFGVTPQQHHGAAITRNRVFQAGEVRTLAISASDQHQLAFDISTQAFDGRQGRADVGSLGIVVVGHPAQLAHPLAAVVQAREGAQGLQHGAERQPHGMAQGQRGQGVGLVVGATDLQFTHRHQLVELVGQVLFAAFLDQAEGLEVGLAQAERPAG
ncbi:hypothetical protein D3C76_854390 [compost metagenome]